MSPGARRAARRVGGPVVWRVHLGAHKTATTHMQRALAAKRPALRKAGVDYLPMPKVRELGLPELHRTLTGADAPRAERRRRLRAEFDTLRRRGGTVAFSEENLLGASRQLLGRRIYPKARTIAGFLALLGQGENVLHLFLGVRSWDTLLPSAYAEMLRRRRPPSGGFGAVRARTLAEPPRWSDLVARLKAGAPKATLTLWRYEDYEAHAREAAGLFLGVDPGPMDDVPRPRGTATPSAEAVAEAEALSVRMTAQRRVEAVQEIFTRLPAEAGGKFQPFAAAERERLREAYEEDLARIDARWPGTLVRWD
ncbi:MAG: hypothetical protein R6V44_17460 [Paracoccaceae bacterium]